MKAVFHSDEPGVRFQCNTDLLTPYGRCTSGTYVPRRSWGRHVIRVRAVDPAGNVDPTPAKQAVVVRRPG